MSTSRLFPYVEILVDRRRTRKRPSPVRSPSQSPVPEHEPQSPNLSPRKKRKHFPDDVNDEALSSKFTQVNFNRQLSPTASEFMVTPDLDSLPPSLASSSAHTVSPSEDEEMPMGLNESLVYRIEDDDIVEDEDLLVDGETPSEDDDDDDDEIPVRFLYDFTIYSMETLEAVPLAELLQISYSSQKFGASGLVRPWVQSDDVISIEGDGEEDHSDGGDFPSMDKDRDRVTLSHILEFSIHNQSEEKGKLDSKIYVRTKFAWYILGAPSEVYSRHFNPFWMRHRLLHLLITASLDNSRITYGQFVDNIEFMDKSEDSVATAAVILGRELDKTDLESDDTIAYILSYLPEVCAENKIQISRVPVIRDIMGPQAIPYDFDKPSRKSISTLSKHHSNKEKEVLKHRSKTFLTPIVNCIAQNLFEGSLEVAESMLYSHGDSGNIKRHDHKGHESNPRNIVWGDLLMQEEDTYESVVVDGSTYQIGDIVMVEPDMDYDPSQISASSQTVNKYGNRWWFCQIRYFFQKSTRSGTTKMFHAQWLMHGCKTILQETSHSKALYLLDTCDDNPISAIYKKCNLTILRPGDDEVMDDGSHNANDFHCGLMYHQEHAEFVDLPSDALIHDLNCGFKSCYACDKKAEAWNINQVHHPKSNTITLFGQSYHVYDFVYLYPTGNTRVLDIGQIMDIRDLQVYVRRLGHYDNYYFSEKKSKATDQPDFVLDERRLYFTCKTDVVSVHKLDGKCYVHYLTDEEEIQQWIERDNHYYLNQEGDERQLQTMKKKDFVYCSACYKDDKAITGQAKKFLQTNSKLIGMELFSGAGGLGIGMNLSSFVETKYAVEFSPSAAKTYMINHPDTTVYCQDSSSLLKHAVAVMNGEDPDPLLSEYDGTPCPPLPDKHEQIDFIFGGPPCQSFSRANHSKRRDDIRSTMACNMLSYVEHYEPNYFLLENVAGFLDHRFYNMRNTSSGVVECEIRSGMVKFVLRTLIALGYQVRYKLLQAGQYGVPQSRSRVIFWGAKRGLPLPEFPIPVYAFPTGVHRTSLPTGGKMNPPTRSQDPDDFHCYAPLRPITVDDAIGDLPPFDWKNPHRIIRAKARDRQEARDRLEDLGIQQFNAEATEGDKKFRNLPGFPQGAQYATEPQNRYQRWLRQRMEDGEKVTGQYTARCASHVVEATTNVPLKPLADHRELPIILLPNHAKPRARNNRNIFYGRMDPDGHFKCAVTSLSPVLKNQWPLHPSQKRIITVREAARAQGFPDDYIFESNNDTAGKIVEDQLRMIGNAVAVPFALALGKELGKAMIKAWEQKQREGSVPL